MEGIGSNGGALKAVLAIAAILLASLLLASVASGAGVYHLDVVKDLSSGAGATCDGWSYDVVDPDGYVSAGPCMYGTLAAGVAHAYGDHARMIFDAPANTRVAAFSLRRSDQLGASQPYGSPVAFVDEDGNVVDQCISYMGCSGQADGVVAASGLTASSITAGVDCGGGPGGSCPAGNASSMTVDGGDVALSASSSPQTSNVSGPLTTATTLSGTKTISYQAADQGGGIYSATLYVDGNPTSSAIANANGGRCQAVRVNADGSRVFDYAVPCPLSTSGTVALDTTQIRDGSHDLELLVDDAAGNQAVAYNGTITTHNGSGSGSAAASSCMPAVSTTVAQQADGSYLLSGAVTCGGLPVPGAQIVVTDSSGLRRTLTATGSGQFTTILKTLHGGLAVNYGHLRFPVAAARKTARITLRISPRHTRNHHRVTLAGTVSGVALAATKRPTLLVEYRAGGAWRPFDTCPVRGNGSFRYRYRFSRTTHATVYHLRVALSSVVASPGRSVRVRP